MTILTEEFSSVLSEIEPEDYSINICRLDDDFHKIEILSDEYLIVIKASTRKRRVDSTHYFLEAWYLDEVSINIFDANVFKGEDVISSEFMDDLDDMLRKEVLIG
jgi:hypothetical protein